MFRKRNVPQGNNIANPNPPLNSKVSLISVQEDEDDTYIELDKSKTSAKFSLKSDNIRKPEDEKIGLNMYSLEKIAEMKKQNKVVNAEQDKISKENVEAQPVESPIILSGEAAENLLNEEDEEQSISSNSRRQVHQELSSLDSLSIDDENDQEAEDGSFGKSTLTSPSQVVEELIELQSKLKLRMVQLQETISKTTADPSVSALKETATLDALKQVSNRRRKLEELRQFCKELASCLKFKTQFILHSEHHISLKSLLEDVQQEYTSVEEIIKRFIWLQAENERDFQNNVLPSLSEFIGSFLFFRLMLAPESIDMHTSYFNWPEVSIATSLVEPPSQKTFAQLIVKRALEQVPTRSQDMQNILDSLS